MLIAFDGDDVGRRLELCLLTDDLVTLRDLSDRVAAALAWLRWELETNHSAIIHLAGGDGLLAEVKHRDIPRIDTLRIGFFERCDCTVSIGVAATPCGVYLALKLAKAGGKDRIVVSRELGSRE